MKLEALRAAGWARDLDVELVRRLEGTFGRPGGEDEDVRVLLALASAATDGGDVCLPLEAGELQDTLRRRAEEEGLEGGEDVWRAAAAGAGKLGESGFAGGAAAGRPFVVEEGRLYLRRYWRYEEETAGRLLELAERGAEEGVAAAVTPEDEVELTEEQKAALRGALAARVTVITGGPGTGKTFVAARLLQILMRRGGTKVVAAAPTGKAAARLKESLAKASGGNGIGAVEAKTVDRLLGWQPGPYFRHDEGHPLREDVVVVDETSMLDLPKAAKLLRALGKDTRLVLLGDEHQLSSVDPGNVMAEICASRRLAGRVKRLTESRRFQAGTDVQLLASAVLAGAKEEAWAKLTGGREVLWRDGAELDVEKNRGFRARLAEGYRGFAVAVDAWKAAGEEEKEAKAKAVLDALGGYRVLCVTRHGPQGTEAVNRAAAALLFPGHGKEDNYDGRVVMVLKNNREIGLYNGDVGVVLGGKAWFAAEGGTKSVPVFLLPEHETAFAMTVHKSQGSEFESVTVVLPEKGCEALLRRELLYTAITRTKTRVDLWCTQAAFAAAVEIPTQRNTGLRAKLDRSPL
jgi:exodeoxyribonuclease V alpha subunit